jgi:DNA-binding GntR family transcriptional regulator
MSAQPLTRLDLNAQAYTELRNWVLTREVGPGEQLNLRTIAETLGVSRSPILHALTRLSAEGLIVTEPRRGFFVKPLTASEVENAHDLRLVLEIFAAERAIPRVTDDDLHGLRLRMNETVVALNAGRRKEYIDVHHEFHRFTVELCANPFVVASYDRLAAHITAARMIAERRGGDEGAVIAAHEEIVAAYEARDIERAKAAVRADIEAGARVALEVIELAGGVL